MHPYVAHFMTLKFKYFRAQLGQKDTFSCAETLFLRGPTMYLQQLECGWKFWNICSILTLTSIEIGSICKLSCYLSEYNKTNSVKHLWDRKHLTRIFYIRILKYKTNVRAHTNHFIYRSKHGTSKWKPWCQALFLLILYSGKIPKH